ncbi:protein lifeguard 1 [Menidia menidia]
MEQNDGRSHEDSEFHPPPYNSIYLEQNCRGVLYQVGKGDIAVVSPPAAYSNMDHPEGPAAVGGDRQDGEEPPAYSSGFEESGFNDAALRKGFIRKVYLTLMIQLLLTVGIICAFLYWSTLRGWVFDNYWFPYSMMSVTLVLILILSCCDNIRRRVPLNFIALGLFTVAEGLMLGSVAAYFEAEAVMWAVGATAFVSFGLSLFAMQSKWDFTAAAGCMWALGWSLFSFALLCAILRSQYLYILYACLGTLLFSFYLVLDTQMILGGKHRKYEISPEEYIFAALNLYLDIVTLFMLLLQFFNLCR